MPRTRPYTEAGLNRVDCRRCGVRKAIHQWRVRSCALGGSQEYVGLCSQCDVAVNKLVLMSIFGLSRDEAMDVLARYSP